MKILLSMLVIFVFTSISAAQDNLENSTQSKTLRSSSKTSRKNILQVEMFGRSLVYGLNYERIFNREVTAGIGFSYLSAQLQPGVLNSSLELMSAPVYVNYYAYTGPHNIVISGGINIFIIRAKAGLSDTAKQAVSDSSDQPNADSFLDMEYSSSATFPLPQASIGYEFRSRSGFMTRTNLYATYAGQVLPWLGISAGVAF